MKKVMLLGLICSWGFSASAMVCSREKMVQVAERYLQPLRDAARPTAPADDRYYPSTTNLMDVLDVTSPSYQIGFILWNENIGLLKPNENGVEIRQWRILATPYALSSTPTQKLHPLIAQSGLINDLHKAKDCDGIEAALAKYSRAALALHNGLLKSFGVGGGSDKRGSGKIVMENCAEAGYLLKLKDFVAPDKYEEFAADQKQFTKQFPKLSTFDWYTVLNLVEADVGAQVAHLNVPTKTMCNYVMDVEVETLDKLAEINQDVVAASGGFSELNKAVRDAVKGGESAGIRN